MNWELGCLIFLLVILIPKRCKPLQKKHFVPQFTHALETTERVVLAAPPSDGCTAMNVFVESTCT